MVATVVRWLLRVLAQVLNQRKIVDGGNSMSREEILAVFHSLAKSQGFYGRLLAWLEGCESDEKEEYLCNLEKQNFADELALILYVEC